MPDCASSRIRPRSSPGHAAVWGVLALILLDWQRVGKQVAFLVAFAGAAVLLRALMWRLPPTDRWHVGLVWLAASALGADWSGLHFMVDTFPAGAAFFGAAARQLLASVAGKLIGVKLAGRILRWPQRIFDGSSSVQSETPNLSRCRSTSGVVAVTRPAWQVLRQVGSVQHPVP